MSMRVVHRIDELRETLAPFRRTAFVPTMGNLHDGHVSLVRIARDAGDAVVASIFVNRLQFAPHEDFESYPRTFDRDSEQLRRAGCDVLFAPDETQLYPVAQDFRIATPHGLGDILEGEFRPGFFEGVATVVMKLFGCVQPAITVFGAKDYQQLMVVRRLVEQFNLPIRVLAGPTVREDDGLAMSSRNGYLDAAQRTEAPALHRALRTLAQNAQRLAQAAVGNAPAARAAALERALADIVSAEGAAMHALRSRGWSPDYVTVRRRVDLAPPTGDDLSRDDALVALGAAKIGNTRLIDNLEF